MTTITGLLPSYYTRSRTVTSKSRILGGLATSTMTTIAPDTKHAHDTSLATLAQDFAYRISKRHGNYQKFSASLLKNKSLLVPTRLALKRQRAALKGPTMQYEPIRSRTFQIELGNPSDITIPDDQRTTTSPDYPRTKSRSNPSTPSREDTPHTSPPDISLMYREKPSYFHPITGNYIVQYTEDHGSPSPCSYVLPRKSCREKNAPAYTFGTRCLVEKKGGSRTAWQKQWFAHSNPFTTKVDFNRENVWPTPCHYPARPTLGFQSSKVTFPAWSMGARLESSPTFLSETNPAPDAYDTSTAFRKLTAKSTPITLKSRIGGTFLSINQSTDITPGPGAHNESKFFSNKHSSPKHSFGKRIPSSLRQDPYVNVLPPMRT